MPAGITGRQRFILAPPAADVHTAQDVWQSQRRPCECAIRSLSRNGMQRRMARCNSLSCRLAAEGLYGGDALKDILTALQLKAAHKGRAVPSVRAELFCRRKTPWRQNFLICFRTGTQKRIPRCCRRRSCQERIGRSGGGVRKDIAGRRALPAVSHQMQAVRSVRGKRSCPDSMISLHCIRGSLNSGTGKRTVR